MIILASQSPRRKDLMELTGYEFKVTASQADETVPETYSPKEVVEYLSYIKAESIRQKSLSDTDDIIIGADTIVTINNEILGKPADKQDAKRMLSLLSDNTHSVFTGVTIIKGNQKETFCCETKVTFYKLTKEEIEKYINTDEPYDKAGAYGIQLKGALFVKRIDGDYSNIVGLPIGELNRRLKNYF